jgi:hypothetical protein
MAYGVVPVFGFIVTGAPAAAVLALVAGVMLCIAVGSYLLKPWAWWLSLAHTLILSASWLTLLFRGRFPDYLAHITRSAPPPTTGPSFQFQQDMFTSPWVLGVGILTMLVWIGFLVYLRRYFAPLPAATAAQAA